MDYKTENTEKGKAEDRKKEQQSRRKIGILAMSAAVVLIILGSICLLLLPNKADSKGEWRTLSREEATWNTRESLDTSKERFKRYGKLKKNYFSQDRPKGVSVWEKGIPACTLGDMYQSDLCAVITVTAGYEEDKNYFEAEAEQYIYDRTGRYADHLFVKDAPARAMSFFGRIPAEEGQRMAVFLDVEASGGRADSIDKATRTAVCKAFCATIQNAGYTAGVYSNKHWLETKMDASALSAYKIWMAQYAAAPTYKSRYDLWQYRSTGSVNGISGNVDMNISYLGY